MKDKCGFAFEHVGLTVRDLENSIRFYSDAFGFKLLRKTKINAYLYLDNELIELMQSEAPRDAKRPEHPEDWDRRMWGPVGLNHLGLRVDDLDAAIDRIIECGGDLVIPTEEFEPEIVSVADIQDDKLMRASKPIGNKFWKIATLADPDGIMIELLER